MEYAADKYAEKTKKGEKEHQGKCRMDQPVTGGTVVMVIRIGMGVKQVSAKH